MSKRFLYPLAAILAAAHLAGCAQHNSEFADALAAPALQAQAQAEPEAEPADAPARERAAERPADAPDLLTRARAIAAAKGLGEAPGTQDAARQALQMAAAARGQNERPAPAAAPPDLADVNERIRLAALRMRAEAGGPAQPLAPTMGAPNSPQASASGSAAADDPREIFRRAREKHLSARAAQSMAFGGLAPAEKIAAAAPAAPLSSQSYFIEAVRRKDAARAGENLFTLTK